MRCFKSLLVGAASVSALCVAAPIVAVAQNAEGVSDDEIVVKGIRGSLRESIDTKRNADAIVGCDLG